jgi:hypothetical protein
VGAWSCKDEAVAVSRGAPEGQDAGEDAGGTCLSDEDCWRGERCEQGVCVEGSREDDGDDAGTSEDAGLSDDANSGGRDDAGGEEQEESDDAGEGEPDADEGDGGSAEQDLPTNEEDAGEGDAGDAGGDDADADDGPGAGTCLSFTLGAEAAVRPVDIVWVVDASPSMRAEIGQIEAGLNLFAQDIATSGQNYHVVLIGSDRQQSILSEAHDYLPICIPPPLSGAPGCPDTDSERFLHVREPIHSREALTEAEATFGQYRGVLRPDARVHFIAVTDDDEGWGSSAEEFAAFADGRAGLEGRWTFHSIVDLVEPDGGCVFDDTCSCGDARGSEYLALSARTGGLALSVCEPDWAPLFSALREEVVVSEAIPCTFEIPSPGDGYVVDYSAVTLVLGVNGQDQEVAYVGNEDGCGPAGGWYYDDFDAPERVILCGASCAQPTTSLSVEFACARVKE